MKLLILLLSLFISYSQANDKPLIHSRLAMGFYYPALSNVSNKTDIQISLNYWVKELTSTIGIDQVYSILYEDIHKMNTDFSRGELDMIIVPPILLSMYFDRTLLSDSFLGVYELGKIDHLIIISNDQNDTNNLPIYQDKHIQLPKDDLLAEIFVSSEVIRLHKKGYKQTFSSISYKDKNQRMILGVFFGKVDMAVIYESALNVMIEMNPQLANTIKVIKKFPLKGRNYSYFHKNYIHQKSLRNEAQRFSSETRGKQILAVFHASDIETCRVSDLDQFDKLINVYQQRLQEIK